MTSKPTAKIWEAVLGELQLQVNKANFETFLKGTSGVLSPEDTLVVRVPKPFVAEWLEKRMRPLISKTVAGILQRPVEIRFEVSTAEEPPQDVLTEAADSSARNVVLDGTTRQRTSQRLNPNYRFDNFIVGPSNRLAHAASAAVADNPGKSFNPLYIWSEPGLGKTHLLHAIGHAARDKNLDVLYVSMEQYVNDFVTSIRERTSSEFRDKYRNVDVLLIDDIQFLSGKESTQEQFFHTFNHLHNESRQIVLTCDRPPTSIPFLELQDRLVSRFQGGLITDIQPPDLETRLAILHAKVKTVGIAIPNEMVEIIGKRVYKNIRELEGALNRIVAMAKLTRTPLTPEMVMDILSVQGSQTKPGPSADSIIEAVAKYFSISKEALCGQSREKSLVLARHVAMYLLREETKKPLIQIGHLLGDRNANTVFHGLQKINSAVSADPATRRHVLEIRDIYSKSGPPREASA